MDAIGLRITFRKNKWPELNKMSEAGQLMMWGLGWTSSIPTGIEFYSYFYSRNIGTSNDARLRLPAFDALYEKARSVPDGAQRTARSDELTGMIFNYAPWILTDYPYQNVVVQPWVRGYKLNGFTPQQWQYYDVGARR
jgi:ABC-type transport system substrate-binding protein